MSREEVDRILTQDITDIELQLEQKIQTIDHITDQLALKANFLAQFQLLLQQEMSHPNAPQQQGQAENETLKEQQPIVAQEKKGDSQVISEFVELDDKQSQRCSRIQQMESQNKCTDQLWLQRDEQLKTQLLDCYGVLKQTKSFYNTLACSIKELVSCCKTQIMQIAKNQIQTIVKQTQQHYEAQLQTVITQNASLKQQLQVLNNKSNPLKELTFNIEHYQDFTITKKLENISLLASQDQLPSTLPQPKLQSFPIKRRSKPSSPNIQYQNYNQFPQYLPSPKICSPQNTKVPTIRPITIGVPPVREGFGILKSGNRTIYRGMWSNGKFQGKGRLQWDNYTYQGEFKQGMFSGYGILQVQGMLYTGRFQNNKAQGEGTIQVGSCKKCGFWRENQLIRQY